MPALAVVRAFGSATSNTVTCTWIGSGEPERSLAQEAGIPFHAVSSGKLRRYFSLANIVDAFRMLAGIWQSWRLLGRLRPDVVFSKGGFVAVPVAVAARMRRIPVVTHESDATPGLSTRILSRFANHILLGNPGTPVWTKKPTTFVGNPVRPEILLGDETRARARFGLRPGMPVLLVCGGSSGAEAINQRIVEIAPHLCTTMDILLQTGMGKAVDLVLPGFAQIEYFDAEQFADALAAADLVVSRAGANTLTELAAARKPSILIPLPLSASRGDQIENAAPLAAAGAAVVLDQDTLTPQGLETTITSLMTDSARRHAMGDLLPTFVQTDAAERIAGILLAVATKSRS